MKLARKNIPAIALVTKEFTEQGNFVARSVGMPDIPRLELPHPVAGTGEKAQSEVARRSAPRVIEMLRGDL